MDIFENGTRFDLLIELNHPLHKEKRSQLSRGAWLNQESVNRVRSSLRIERWLLYDISLTIFKKAIITSFSGSNGIDPIAQVFYFFYNMGFERIGERVKADCNIIRMVT